MSTAPTGPGHPAPPPPARSSRTWPALTTLFAVISLALAGVLLWPSGEAEAEEPVLGSAQSTVEMACQILDEVPTEGVGLGSEEYFVVQGQVSVAASLGWLASAHDAEFTTFRTLTEKPYSLALAHHPVDGPEFTQALDEALADCAERLDEEG